MKTLFIFLLVLNAFATLVHAQDKESDTQTKTVLGYAATATGTVGLVSGLSSYYMDYQKEKMGHYIYFEKTLASKTGAGGIYSPMEKSKIDEVARANNSMARQLVLEAYPTNKEGAKQLAILEAEANFMKSVAWADKKKLDEITKRIEGLKSGKILAPEMKYYTITLKGELGAAQTLKKLNFVANNTYVKDIRVIQNFYGMGKLSDRYCKIGIVSFVASIASSSVLIYELVTSGGLSRFLGINDKANNENRLTGKPVENNLSNQSIETKVAGQ